MPSFAEERFDAVGLPLSTRPNVLGDFCEDVASAKRGSFDVPFI